MKLKFLKPAALAALALAGFSACEDSTFIEGNAIERVSYLYLNYCNPDTTGAGGMYGNKPMIELDEDNTSKDVIIDFSKPFFGKVEGSNMTKIIIDNVRFFDEYGSYKIKDIRVDEQRDNNWVTQSKSQNPITYNDLKELDVAVVIDNSSYLEKQFGNLKSNAESFVRTIARRFPQAQFTVAATSGDVDNLNVTALASSEDAISTIQRMEKNQYSYLYTASGKALAELSEGSSSSKVLVYFGAENYSANEDKSGAKDSITTLLDRGVYSNVSVFAIGYSDDGLLASETLSNFCRTGRGFAIYPGSGDKLSEFFDYFSNSVATAYTITYSHEATMYDVDEKQPIRFKFVLEQQR